MHCLTSLVLLNQMMKFDNNCAQDCQLTMDWKIKILPLIELSHLASIWGGCMKDTNEVREK